MFLLYRNLYYTPSKLSLKKKSWQLKYWLNPIQIKCILSIYLNYIVFYFEEVWQHTRTTDYRIDRSTSSYHMVEKEKKRRQLGNESIANNLLASFINEAFDPISCWDCVVYIQYQIFYFYNGKKTGILQNFPWRHLRIIQTQRCLWEPQASSPFV